MTTDAERPLRIVVADDSYLVREALAHLLGDTPELELVATCEDGDALLAAVDAELPDAILTDIRMPPSREDEGIAIANRLRETHPSIGVVVVSQYASPQYALALLEHGSDGRAYLLKERLSDRAQLIAALRAVAEGGSVVDSKVVDALITARLRASASPLGELTPRELEILSEIAQGKTNQAIAEQLFLTKRAVEKHINAIFLKLGLTSAEDFSRRVKAALIYLAHQGDGSARVIAGRDRYSSGPRGVIRGSTVLMATSSFALWIRPAAGSATVTRSYARPGAAPSPRSHESGQGAPGRLSGARVSRPRIGWCTPLPRAPRTREAGNRHDRHLAHRRRHPGRPVGRAAHALARRRAAAAARRRAARPPVPAASPCWPPPRATARPRCCASGRPPTRGRSPGSAWTAATTRTRRGSRSAWPPCSADCPRTSRSCSSSTMRTCSAGRPRGSRCGRIVAELPAAAVVAIATRGEAPLPLARLRAQQRLVELGAGRLAMTREETAELLGLGDRRFAADELDALARLTEGWPGGLSLALIAVADGRAPAQLTGADPYFADYLDDEILSALTPAERVFLRRSSVLESLSGPACDVVLERNGLRGGARAPRADQRAARAARPSRRALPPAPAAGSRAGGGADADRARTRRRAPPPRLATGAGAPRTSTAPCAMPSRRTTTAMRRGLIWASAASAVAHGDAGAVERRLAQVQRAPDRHDARARARRRDDAAGRRSRRPRLALGVRGRGRGAGRRAARGVRLPGRARLPRSATTGFRA